MAPKRPATTFTADQPTNRAAAALAGKRVKFAPNNAETVAAADGADDLELDLEQGAGGPSRKRNKVTTEGYDSDSSAESDGGFGGAGGGRAGRGVGQQAAEPDEDQDEDDMFGGGGTRKDTGLDIKGKKKEKEFLEMGDIEGQEFSKKDDEDFDEADDESEEDYLPEDDEANDDEAPRGRRSKKGMGYSLTSFNMKEELGEGRFTSDGTYVANKVDPLAKNDVWLDGLSKRSIRAAKEAKERMDARQKEREAEEAKSEEQLTQLRDDCLIGLLSLVRPGETVARALTRLGTAKKRAETADGGWAATTKAKGKSAARNGDAMDLDEGMPASRTSDADLSPTQRHAKKIDRLTHFASTLLSSHGELEIYDETYEQIIKTLKAEGAVRRDWVPPVDPDIEREKAEAAAHAKAEADAASAARGPSSGRSRVVIARPGAGAPAAVPTGAQYYYKWNSPPPGQPPDQEYGPYDRATFEQWVAGGYFGDEASRITVRKDGEQRWASWKELR
ncbi:hypothetical protein JCM10296v2_001930 [Rhodotorula toruloides]